MKHLLSITILLLLASFYSCKSPGKKSEEKKVTIADTSRKLSDVSQIARPEIDSELQDDSLSKSGDTKVIFPAYAVVIHDFKVYDRFDENGKLEYDIDPKEVIFNSNKDRVVTLTMLKDTFHTSNSIHSSFFQNKIEVIPHNKGDRFKICFSFQVRIFWGGITNTKEMDQNVTWCGMTDYTSLIDSAFYFFKMPPKVFESDFSRNDIKKKISARDTLVKYEDETESEATIVYKNKPCIIVEDATYLRIQRENNGKLIDTKFIKIDRPYID